MPNELRAMCVVLPRPLSALTKTLNVLVLIAISGCGSTPDLGPVSIKLLYPYAGKGDRSFSDLAFEGLFRAMQEFELSKEEVVPDNHEQASSVLCNWLEHGPSTRELIVVVGFSYADILSERNWDISGHSLLLIDYAAPSHPGLLSASYRTFAPSYLAGLASARVSKTRRVSAIGAMRAKAIDDFVDGFRSGAESEGSTFIGPYYLAEDAAGFSLTAEARETTLNLVSEHAVDVVFPVAGGAGLGVVEAAQESGGTLFTVGVDADQSYLAPRASIGSVVKRIDRIILDTIRAVADGGFAAGQLSLGLESGDTDFVLNPHFAEELSTVVGLGRDRSLAAESAYLLGNLP
jgi:basic membrane protein A and related proteins